MDEAIEISSGEDSEPDESVEQPPAGPATVLTDEEWFLQVCEEELSYYDSHQHTEEEVKRAECTICRRQVVALRPGAAVRHPRLGVLICRTCNRKYHDGEWTRDGDGYFEHCVWCGDGGDLLMCDRCKDVFCKSCIRKNLGRAKVTEIEETEDWVCLSCAPRQVWAQRCLYHSIYHHRRAALAQRQVVDQRRQTLRFIEETLQDSTDVSRILGDSLDKVGSAWTKRRDQPTDQEVVKMVKKLRTIFSITQYNLRLLDETLVSSTLASLPGIESVSLAVPSHGGTSKPPTSPTGSSVPATPRVVVPTHRSPSRNTATSPGTGPPVNVPLIQSNEVQQQCKSESGSSARESTGLVRSVDDTFSDSSACTHHTKVAKASLQRALDSSRGNSQPSGDESGGSELAGVQHLCEVVIKAEDDAASPTEGSRRSGASVDFGTGLGQDLDRTCNGSFSPTIGRSPSWHQPEEKCLDSQDGSPKKTCQTSSNSPTVSVKSEVGEQATNRISIPAAKALSSEAELSLISSNPTHLPFTLNIDNANSKVKKSNLLDKKRSISSQETRRKSIQVDKEMASDASKTGSVVKESGRRLGCRTEQSSNSKDNSGIETSHVEATDLCESADDRCRRDASSSPHHHVQDKSQDGNDVGNSGIEDENNALGSANSEIETEKGEVVVEVASGFGSTEKTGLKVEQNAKDRKEGYGRPSTGDGALNDVTEADVGRDRRDKEMTTECITKNAATNLADSTAVKSNDLAVESRADAIRADAAKKNDEKATDDTAGKIERLRKEDGVESAATIAVNDASGDCSGLESAESRADSAALAKATRDNIEPTVEMSAEPTVEVEADCTATTGAVDEAGDIDELAVAKMAVLRETSSEPEETATFCSQRDEAGAFMQRKKLKTKKQLDRIRRASGPPSNDLYSSSDDDLEAASSQRSRHNSNNSAKSLKAGAEKKRDCSSERSSHMDMDQATALSRFVMVDIPRLPSMARHQLEKHGTVDLDDFPSLAKGVRRRGEASEIERLCNFKKLKVSRHHRRRSSCSSETEQRRLDVRDGRGHVRGVKKLGLADMSCEESDPAADSSEKEEQGHILNPPEPPLTDNLNELAKASVLLPSSGDEEVPAALSSDSEENQPKEKQKEEKRPTAAKNNGTAAVEEEVEDGDKEQEEEEVRRPGRPKLLAMRLTESDSSEDKDRKRKQAGKRGPSESGEDPTAGTSSLSGRRRRTRQQRIIESDGSSAENDSDIEDEEENSDEDEIMSSDSDVVRKKRSKRKAASSSSENSEEEEEKKQGPRKRRRIRTQSDSDGTDEEGDEEGTSKGRHKIRKVIKDKHLAEETKEAAAEERDRRKRIEERQAAYNKIFSMPEGKDATCDQLVLDFDPKTKEILVEVHRKLVTKLKPHQAKGVKFMWDACFESLAQVEAGKVPGGAILAHCMGLGKTLQTITLAHTILENPRVRVHRVLIICPVNTVKNWEDEFEKWLKGNMEVNVYGMSGEKDNWSRADKLNGWFREGGVLIIGYDMFRNLTNEKNKKFKAKQRTVFNQCLLDPGPDLVVCDEGHLLKNEKSAINKAVNRIRTQRRIILTGTPLQNNLKEYYEMVNFVKPNLLGTRKEFMNRFVNPISNGQHSDSTDRDIRMMKQRSFVLSDLLKGCMQRLDYNVLVPYLQPKLEYVLSINMTDIQRRLYKFYLENYAKAGQVGLDGRLEGGKKGGLFYDAQNLARIWNHPYILQLAKNRRDKNDREEDDDEEGSLKDFIDDGDESEVSGSDSDIQEVDESGEDVRRSTRQNKNEELFRGLDEVPVESSSRGWWNQLLAEDTNLDDLEFGSKMVLLMDILKECELIGDKVLVFSQSLLSLDLIEEFLARASDEPSGDIVAGQFGTWIPGKDYYRMDGSTGADTRKMWCKYFNKSTSHRMRLFLISTRAGGLGINLVAANRVIIFDASWNPSHDIQSIFRVYRFGQIKPVYIYRFLAKGTMEEKIYDRQVTKQSLAARVVDEQQIERHFTMNELAELYEFTEEPLSERPVPIVPEDRLLAELVDKHKESIWKIHNHDSLLENQVDENLTEAERKAAWEEYENEKKGLIQTNIGIDNIANFGAILQSMLPRSGDGRVMASPINPMAIQEQLRVMNPGLSHEELLMRTRNAIMQLQNLHRTQTPVIVNENTLGVGQRQAPGYDQSFYQQEMAKAKAMISQQYPGMYRFRGGGIGGGGGGMGGVSRGMPGLMGYMPRPRMPMFKPFPVIGSPPEEIILDEDPDPVPLLQQRRQVRPPMAMRGAARGRGGRRGRPRLDPDTDLDFSPEPTSTSAANLAIIQQLQAQGMTVRTASGANES